MKTMDFRKFRTEVILHKSSPSMRSEEYQRGCDLLHLFQISSAVTIEQMLKDQQLRFLQCTCIEQKTTGRFVYLTTI